MLKVSDVEKELLSSMVELSKNHIVEATLKEIVINSGRKITGGIHTHAIHNLESMGLIRKIGKRKWVILQRDINAEGKGTRIVFENTHNQVLKSVLSKMEMLKKYANEKNVNLFNKVVEEQIQLINYYI